MRRRALLAASAASGGKSITFPVFLIEGDNGEIGIKLFEYIVENAYNYTDYQFKSNEGVYVDGININYAVIISDSMIGLSGDFPSNILTVNLFNTGVLTIVYD